PGEQHDAFVVEPARAGQEVRRFARDSGKGGVPIKIDIVCDVTDGDDELDVLFRINAVRKSADARPRNEIVSADRLRTVCTGCIDESDRDRLPVRGDLID